MNEDRLGAFLVKLGIITAEQLHLARQEQQLGSGSLTKRLVGMSFVTEEELGRLAATALRLPYVPLDRVNIPPKLVKLMSRDQARRVKGLVVKNEGKRFWIATSDPNNMQAIDDAQFQLGGRVSVVVAAETEVIRSIGHFYQERIAVDRPYNLPFSDSLNLDAPEIFDIQAARARRAAADAAAAPAKLDLRAAAMDRLAAAARTVEISAPEPEEDDLVVLGEAEDEIVDADELEIVDLPEAPAAKPAAAKPTAPPPVQAPPPVVAPPPQAASAAPVQAQAPADDFFAALSEAAFGVSAQPQAGASQAFGDSDLLGLFMNVLDGTPDSGAGAGGDAGASPSEAPMSGEDAAKELAALLLGMD